MKDRIHQIQDREGMSQKDFAAAIGISQASLSSIYNGRTLPTSRHVEAIHKRFPEIDTNWLMFGEGEMLASASSTEDEGVRPVEVEEPTSEQCAPMSNQFTPEPLPVGQKVIREIVKYVDKPQRRIREIQVIYDDGIIETFVLKTDK